MRLLLAVLMLLPSALQSFGSSPNDALMKRVNEFCATEFNGDHAKRVLFFPAHIRDKNAVDFVTDPINIVDSYRVVSIVIKGNTARVVLEYGLIAELQNVVYHNYPGGAPDPAVVLNLADKLVIRRNPTFHQELIWKFNEKDQVWYVVSTELPKVSQLALLELLRSEVRGETDTLRKNSGKSLPYLEGLRTWHLKKIDEISNLGAKTARP